MNISLTRTIFPSFRNCLLLVSLFTVAIGCGISDGPAANDIQRTAETETTEDDADAIDDPLRSYFELFATHANTGYAALQKIEAEWEPGSAGLLIESLRFLQNPEIVAAAIGTLQKKTGLQHTTNDEWHRWLWNAKPKQHADHARFKSKLYSNMDTRFLEYFDNARPATIRLDEIVWGGVVRDGIPPLKNPRMMPAEKATFLKDSNVVFGIEVNGDARAYPKRILAWHEMFKDTIGGVSINGVYCTLCGSMIVYETDVNGTHHELGTSGFLYRSNKLMYDRATKSLWSTLRGEPVVGPLVGQGIRLPRRYVVTTTWGDWKRTHPETKVLSIMTGFERDYSEGAAYSDYFSNDQLMFAVPSLDAQLPNKQSVLALRNDAEPYEPVAFDTKFLRANSVHHDQLGQQAIVVLTTSLDEAGAAAHESAGFASRVYFCGDVRFKSAEGRKATDADGRVWTIQESRLQCDADEGQVLTRTPAHQVFWFGWFNAFPTTRLVK